MCVLSALVMPKLKCAIVVSMLVFGMELKASNCCSVCSMNDGQFALFAVYVSYLVWCGYYRSVRVVIMIGRCSEGSLFIVRHVVFCSTVGEQ